jgi:hypothetical protein
MFNDKPALCLPVAKRLLPKFTNKKPLSGGADPMYSSLDDADGGIIRGVIFARIRWWFWLADDALFIFTHSEPFFPLLGLSCFYPVLLLLRI